MSKQVIILLGKSGSGKGTQAELLKEKFGYAHVISGDLLRSRAKKSDFTGKKLANVLAHGGLAPTGVIFKLWLDKMEKIENDENLKGVILDGNPRKIKEAYLVDEVFDWYEWKNVKAILIDISDQVAAFRLGKRRICKNKKCGNIIPFTDKYKDIKKCPKCGSELILRNDDNPKSVEKRLSWFKTEVQPIVDYYKKTGRLVKINGEGTIEDIFKEILKAIK
ncbi:MAG: nucleoside monophosphate kinase [Candidatus Staskawiczbacteria bacterium]|jgi:adenylate kinase